MSDFIGTVQDLATAQKVEYIVASGFVRFLELKGIAKKTGTRSKGGKGKPSNVYTIPGTVTLVLYEAPPPPPAMILSLPMVQTETEIDYSEVNELMPAA